jgi:tight adherence protein B
MGVLFAGLGAAVPFAIQRRRHRKESEALEGQVGELASTVAQAVRSGLSISRAIEAAALDAEAPMLPLLDGVLAEQRLGVPLDSALSGLAHSIGTDDARLLVLILVTHSKSGGNIAIALQEVAATIRHRVEARRELRALTAQGRISGAILGSLPIGFFILMAAMGGHELGTVYRSGAGMVMVLVGLGLESLAYLWIRRLLRIEV